MLRKIAGFACLVGSLGGGTAESVRDPGACPGRCERSIVYTLDARFDTGERGVIGEAMRVWENGTSGRVCFLAGGHGGEDLVVEKLDRSEQLRPWDPDWSQHVALTKDDHIWIVAPRIDDADEYRALVVHELGHHLGIGHIEDAAATYMHSMINDTPVELRLHARLPERDARAFCQVVRCTCSL